MLFGCATTEPVPEESLENYNVCYTYESLEAHLMATYGEVRDQIGIAAPGQIFVLFLNEGNGSWTTAIVTEGVACVIASGEGWVSRKKPTGTSL